MQVFAPTPISGVPQIGNGYMGLVTPGRVYFVSSLIGKNAQFDGTGQGTDPELPFASMNFASTQCRANKGDIVVVLPGHVETITAAAGLALAKAGVWFLGVGVGRDQPQITIGGVVGATIAVSAARVRLQNFRISCVGIDALTGPIAVDAAEFELLDCNIELANASNQATLGMLTTANASRMRVQRCQFFGTSDAGTTAAIRLVGGDDILIQDCVFYGAYGAGNGAIENITTAVTNLRMIGNTIDNRTASSTKAIVLLAGTSGLAANNRMQILSGTAPITGAGLSWVGGNYYAATIATAGTLI